ncbi:MAG: FimV/HubP family polar landmark protein, partial [Vibrionaceae bacterium]
ATVRILGPKEESPIPEEVRRVPMQNLPTQPTSTGIILQQVAPALETYETQAKPALPASSVPARKRVGPTQKNDTLWKIASRNTPKGASIYQVIGAIFHLNPQAFAEDNIHLLEPGSILLMPTQDEIKKERVQAVSARLDQDQPAATRYRAANRAAKNEKSAAKTASSAQAPADPIKPLVAEVTAVEPAKSVPAQEVKNELPQAVDVAGAEKEKSAETINQPANAPAATLAPTAVENKEPKGSKEPVQATTSETPAQNKLDENSSKEASLSDPLVAPSEGSRELSVPNGILAPENQENLAQGEAIALTTKEYDQLLAKLEQMLESDHRLKVRLGELQNQVDELIKSNLQQQDFNQTLQAQLEQGKKPDEPKLTQSSPTVFDHLVEKPWLLALSAILPALLLALVILLFIKKPKKEDKEPAQEQESSDYSSLASAPDSESVKSELADTDDALDDPVLDDQQDELLEFDELLEEMLELDGDENVVKDPNKKEPPQSSLATESEPDAQPVVINEPPQSLEFLEQELSEKANDETELAAEAFEQAGQAEEIIELEEVTEDEINDTLMPEPLLSAQEPSLADDKTEPLLAPPEAQIEPTPSFAFDLDDEELTKQLDQEFAELIEMTKPTQEIAQEEGDDEALIILDADSENLIAASAEKKSISLDEQKRQVTDVQEIEPAGDVNLPPLAKLPRLENETHADENLALDEQMQSLLEQESVLEVEPTFDVEPTLGAEFAAEPRLHDDFKVDQELEIATKDVEIKPEPEPEPEPELEELEPESAPALEIESEIEFEIEAASKLDLEPLGASLQQESVPAENPSPVILPQKSEPKRNSQGQAAKKELSKDILSQLNPGQKLAPFEDESLQVAGLDIATLWDEGEVEAELAPVKVEPSFAVSDHAFDEIQPPATSFDEEVTAK